jgi:DGQHR domain-containing protein
MTSIDSEELIPPEQAILFPCIEVKQPIGTFYIGAIPAAELALISFADMRAIQQGETRDVEEFSGIQRPLSKDRVKELQRYVQTVDAAFPTSIILHIASKDAEFTSLGVMRVRRDRAIAKIIDGQHRIAGLQDYKGPPFDLNVTIFINMDPEDQALLFATINLKQTKVNKSLAYDLYDFAQTRSPQKTCHNIARLLNSKEGSPFYHKIKILGTATEGRNETLTQAVFVDRLIGYISADAMHDRDEIKRGRPLPTPTGKEKKEMIFRGFFGDDKDAELAKILWNYFEAVAQRWPGAWEEKTRGRILNRNTGFSALMRFLYDVYRSIAERATVPTTEAFKAVFDRIPLTDDSFTPDNYLPGTTGEAKLYQDLRTGAGYK